MTTTTTSTKTITLLSTAVFCPCPPAFSLTRLCWRCICPFCIGGALSALSFQCAQTRFPLRVFPLRENAL